MKFKTGRFYYAGFARKGSPKETYKQLFRVNSKIGRQVLPYMNITLLASCQKLSYPIQYNTPIETFSSDTSFFVTVKEVPKKELPLYISMPYLTEDFNKYLQEI
jgi:hypothetical protein